MTRRCRTHRPIYSSPPSCQRANRRFTISDNVHSLAFGSSKTFSNILPLRIKEASTLRHAALISSPIRFNQLLSLSESDYDTPLKFETTHRGVMCQTDCSSGRCAIGFLSNQKSDLPNFRKSDILSKSSLGGTTTKRIPHRFLPPPTVTVSSMYNGGGPRKIEVLQWI